MSLLNVPARVFSLLFLNSLLAYWPVVSFSFALKNDAINYFLPVRYSVSAALRSGHLPYWSPYIYMGYPLNGDLQGGAFNPLLWFISLFHQYNLYSLHLETFFYIFLASIGAYKILAENIRQSSVIILIAAVYPLCGFFTDSGQNIAWLANAAVLPFAYLYFQRLFTSGDYRNSLKLALSLFMLLVVGYPFFLLYTVYLFGGCWLGILMYRLLKKRYSIAIRLLTGTLAAAAFFCILSLAPVLHYWDMLPYYNRGSGLSLAYSMTNSLPPLSLLSWIAPWATFVPHTGLDADMSTLNSYFGFLLLPFIVLCLSGRRNKSLYLIIALTVLSLLLSLGKWTPLRSLAYQHLPGMDSFRHPANFRIFFIQGLLFLGARGLVEYLESGYPVVKRKLLISMGGACLITLILSSLYLPSWNVLIHSMAGLGLSSALDTLQHSSFNERILACGCLQLIFLYFAFQALKHRNPVVLLAIIWLNVLVFQQIALFTTFVSKTSVATVNRSIRQVSDFPIPDIRNQTVSGDSLSVFASYPPGLKYVFLQQVVIQKDYTNPTFLKSYSDFTHDSVLVDALQSYPVAFLGIPDTAAGRNPEKVRERDFLGSTAGIKIVRFGPNRFLFQVQSVTPQRLCLFQNDYLYWKAYIDGKEVPITKWAGTFMSIQLPAGLHRAEFKIDPGWKEWTYLEWMAALLFSIFILIIPSFRNET